MAVSTILVHKDTNLPNDFFVVDDSILISFSIIINDGITHSQYLGIWKWLRKFSNFSPLVNKFLLTLVCNDVEFGFVLLSALLLIPFLSLSFLNMKLCSFRFLLTTSAIVHAVEGPGVSSSTT